MLNSPLAVVVKSPWFVVPFGLTILPWNCVLAGKPLRLGRDPKGGEVPRTQPNGDRRGPARDKAFLGMPR